MDENKKVKKEKSELVLFIRDMLISFAVVMIVVMEFLIQSD